MWPFVDEPDVIFLRVATMALWLLAAIAAAIVFAF